MTSAEELLAEAFAWWKVGEGRDCRSLSQSAAEALVGGLDSSALRELAGIGTNENPFDVDALIIRSVEELSLDGLMTRGQNMLAARRLSRWVLSGEVPERDLARWAHDRFHHESDIEALNRLAELDDDLDLNGHQRSRADEVEQRIREVAAGIVDLG